MRAPKGLSKASLYVILTGIFVGMLLVSNIIAFKLFEIGGVVFPAGVIVFPIVYIINDILAEVYGFKKARRVILIGFAVNLMAVIAYNIAMVLPAPIWFGGDEAFNIVLGSTFRLLIASFAAYLVGTTMNSKVMVSMRKGRASGSKGLFLRAMTSTLVGESLDSIIFITIAFSFMMPTGILIEMIIFQILFKTVYEIIVFPLTDFTIKLVNTLPEGDC